MTAKPFWLDTPTAAFPPLAEDVSVDVAIVGGGLTGVSAAYLLRKAGQRVALLERDQLARLDTGHTTAHLTFVTDLRLRELVDRFGVEKAKAVWEAGRTAIRTIEQIASSEGIDCEFERAPGYLHAPLTGERDDTLAEEARSACALGFEAEFVKAVPVIQRPGVRFANQAVYHPLKYVAELAQRIPGSGSYVFEHSEVTAIEQGDGVIRVSANGGTVSCQRVVIATDVPLTGLANLVNATLFQTKIAPYTSYAIGAHLPKGVAPQGCFWDTSDPYYYLRIKHYPTWDQVIFGGLDHKTGQVEHSCERFERLKGVLHSILPETRVDRHWSGQVIESADGLPFIGEISPGQFVATGFSGNGMTFGTVSAMMAVDWVTGRPNPWSELFDPKRKWLSGGALTYLRENADYPYYMVKDRLSRPEDGGLASLSPGTGKVMIVDGRRVAAYRDHEGGVTLLSPVCTHLGCIVHWNEAESTWDCPCHGSRFRPKGEVLAGPAETPLGRDESH